MSNTTTSTPTSQGKILFHRVWHVGVGRMSTEKASAWIKEFRQQIKQQGSYEKESFLADHFGDGLIFYDVVVPCHGSVGSDVTITVVRPSDDVINQPTHGNKEHKYD